MSDYMLLPNHSLFILTSLPKNQYLNLVIPKIVPQYLKLLIIISLPQHYYLKLHFLKHYLSLTTLNSLPQLHFRFHTHYINLITSIFNLNTSVSLPQPFYIETYTLHLISTLLPQPYFQCQVPSCYLKLNFTTYFNLIK